MARSHSESVAINVSAGFVLMVVNSILSFVVRTIFIRMMGAQYNGVSTLFTDILGFLSLAEMGISSAITFALYKPIRERDHRRIGALMNFYRRAYRVIALVVFVAGLCVMPFLHLLVRDVPDIEENIRVLFFIFLVNNASSYLMAYKQTLLVASERRYVISRVNLTFAFVRSAVECAVLFFTQNYILYLVVGLVDALTRNFIILRKADKAYPELGQYRDEKLDKQEVQRLHRDVGALALYKVCHALLTSTDSIVISAAPALGVVVVGNIGNYRLIFNTITNAVNQFFQAFNPSLGSMIAHSDTERQHVVFETTNFLSFWAMCFCCTSLFCLSVPFARNMWGREFAMPMDVIAVMTFNFYTSAMLRPTNAFRDGNGLFVEGRFRPVAMAIINIALDIVLVRRMGVVGVLLATSVARISTQAWFDPLLLYRKVFGRSVKTYYKNYVVYTLITALSCAVTYGLSQWILSYDMPIVVEFFLLAFLCVSIPNLLVFALYRKSPAFIDAKNRFAALFAKFKAKLARGKSPQGPGSASAPDDDAQGD